MTQKHTPIPWDIAARMTYTIADAQGRVITSMRTGRDVSPEEAISNARFILQAVNAHEDLLAALQVLVLTPHILDHLEANDPMALKQARAAIAKATRI